MRFYLGSDHAAVELRQAAAEWLAAAGHEIVGVIGPALATDKVDYPDVAIELCAVVAAKADTFGVLVCGTGQGMAITANRLPGIRAVVCADVFSARMGRAHNDANVLCLGARVVGLGLAQEIVAAFCGTGFEGGRHQRRVGKIQALDKPAS